MQPIYCRRPKVGDQVKCKFGTVTVAAVNRDGRELTVNTPSHGVETIERGDLGWWTTYPKAKEPK